MYLKTFSQRELPIMWTFTIKMLHFNLWWHVGGLVGFFVLLKILTPLSSLIPQHSLPICEFICKQYDVLHGDALHFKKIKRYLGYGVEMEDRNAMK